MTDLPIDDNSADSNEAELLRRILAGKRASEGTLKFGPLRALATERRKGSLIPTADGDNLLPPVTEGVMLALQQQKDNNVNTNQDLQSQNLIDSFDKCSSTSSLRSISIKTNSYLNRRNSIATNEVIATDSSNTSCSSKSSHKATSVSTTSLSETGSGKRSRCSSIISQCSVTSSVLSESARQQLNFTLSPDLPLDCNDLYEANNFQQTGRRRKLSSQFGSGSIERPASPEPPSLMSNDGDYVEFMTNGNSNSNSNSTSTNGDGACWRPESRFDSQLDMEANVQKLQTNKSNKLPGESPDSTLGDSTSSDDAIAPNDNNSIADRRNRSQKLNCKRRMTGN